MINFEKCIRLKMLLKEWNKNYKFTNSQNLPKIVSSHPFTIKAQCPD